MKRTASCTPSSRARDQARALSSSLVGTSKSSIKRPFRKRLGAASLLRPGLRRGQRGRWPPWRHSRCRHSWRPRGLLGRHPGRAELWRRRGARSLKGSGLRSSRVRVIVWRRVEVRRVLGMRRLLLFRMWTKIVRGLFRVTWWSNKIKWSRKLINSKLKKI